MESMMDRLAGTTPPPAASEKRVDKSPNGVMVIPYNASVDERAHVFLPWAWERLSADGLVSLYYPGQEKTGFANFAKMMGGGAQILQVLTRDADGQPDKWMGFISWEPMPLGAAMVALAGFIFLKEYWDQKYTDDAAQEVMRHWFTKTDLDVVIGVVAEKNALAERFLKRIGWTQTGTIPKSQLYKGEACDAHLWCTTKSEWLAKENG